MSFLHFEPTGVGLWLSFLLSNVAMDETGGRAVACGALALLVDVGLGPGGGEAGFGAVGGAGGAGGGGGGSAAARADGSGRRTAVGGWVLTTHGLRSLARRFFWDLLVTPPETGMLKHIDSLSCSRILVID